MSSLQCPTTILLARHGEVDYETETWAEEGGSLTSGGRRAAAALADDLRGRRVAHVWTSTLSRAVPTAEIVAAGLGVAVTTREGLREFAPGDLASRPRTEDPFADVYRAWLSGDLDVRVPGAESGAEVVARFEAVLAEIADRHPGETVLAVAHGGLLRLGVPALCSTASVRPARVPWCGVIEVAVDVDDRTCLVWPPPPGG